MFTTGFGLAGLESPLAASVAVVSLGEAGLAGCAGAAFGAALAFGWDAAGLSVLWTLFAGGHFGSAIGKTGDAQLRQITHFGEWCCR